MCGNCKRTEQNGEKVGVTAVIASSTGIVYEKSLKDLQQGGNAAIEKRGNLEAECRRQ
jgi:hypothetical protein